MTQLRDRRVSAESMVRTRAFRQGYESYRLGQAPDFVARGDKTLAYEYGRLTAAYLRGRGDFLRRLPVDFPLGEDRVPRMARALLDCIETPQAPAP